MPLHLAFLGNGTDYHIQKWLPALVEAGLRVTLLTYAPPPEPLPGVAVEPLRPPFRLRGRVSWVDFWGPTRALRRRLEAIGADVLLGSYATHYGWLASRVGFRPFIAQTWTFDVTVYPFVGWRRWMLGPMVRATLRRADAILTDGEALADRVRTLYPREAERVVAATWGIRLADYTLDADDGRRARARLGIPEAAPVVVSGRGVRHYYRPECTLPALERWLKEHPDGHAVVLTLGHERTDAVQAHLDALAAHPRGHVFDRFLSKPEMQEIWAAADILVSVPTHDGISEGILEGMLAGIVPVVNDIPSNRSFLPPDEAACYVDGPAPEDLARTLSETARRLPDLRRTLVPRNRDWVRRHASVEATAREVAALVARVHAGRATLSSFRSS